MFGPFVLVTPLFAIVCVVVVTVVVHPRRRRLVAIDEVSYPQLADLRRTSPARANRKTGECVTRPRKRPSAHSASALATPNTITAATKPSARPPPSLRSCATHHINSVNPVTPIAYPATLCSGTPADS